MTISEDHTFWKTMGFKMRKMTVLFWKTSQLILRKRVITLIVISTCLQTLNAATFNWNVGAGDWASGGNWNPVGPPTISDTANIANGGSPRTDTDSPTAGNIITDNSSDINFTSQNLTSQTAIIGNTSGNCNVDLPVRTWNNNTGAGSLIIGASGSGTVQVHNAGKLNTTSTQIAQNAGSTGSATVGDPGSAWNNSGDLQVGVSGNVNNFQVQGSASLNSGSTEFGVNAGPSFTAQIRDANTSFTNAGNLVVGVSRTCTLSVQNNAKASTGSCVVGQNTGITGNLTVTNPATTGTTWTCTGAFTIGQSGTGNFNLTNFATALTGTTTLGSLAGSSGNVAFDSSTWTNTGTLTIGNAGIGLMNITGNAHLTTGNISVAVSNSGTLNVTSNSILTTSSITGGAGVGSFTLNNATLQASANNASFISGLTTATLSGIATFDSQAFTIVVPQNLTGAGTLTKIGNGTLILTGTNTLSGTGVITTGTLQGNAANLPQAGITDNSTLVFDQTTPGTYASNITGTGSLVKQGASTLILTGTNSYAAGTIISAGTLQGNTASIPASNGVLDNGILVFDQATNATYSGNITGTGAFVKQNAGTLILSGTNTYAGGTTITGGALQGSTTNIPSGPVLNNSILIFDQPTTGVFSGNISGTGMLIKQNAGLLILSGANNYTGSTTITGGILQGNTNSIPSGSVIDNATFVLDQNFDGVFGGSISGTGAFLKQGTGTVVLTGNSLGFAGSTTVVAGNLKVNGILGSLLTVNPGATLSGIGTVGNVILNGIISPGNSIGTITVNSLVINPTGVYEAEINSMGQSDLIAAAGPVTINGGTLAVSAAPGIYLRGTNYTIIQAAGGVAGQFATTLLPTNVLLSVNYFPTSVVLTVLTTNLDTFGLTGNALRVAEYIRDHTSANPDMLGIIAALNTLTPEQEQKALDQMHPALFEALALTAADTAHMINNTFIDRLRFLRHSYDPCNFSPLQRGNMWVAAAGDFVRQNKSQGLRGFNTASEGIAVGLDNKLYDALYGGVGVAYSRTNLHWENSAGHSDINSYYAGSYLTYGTPYYFIDATLLGFIDNYNVRRHIHFANIDRTAKHRHYSYGFNPHLGFGLNMYYCGVDVIPFANADYYFVQQNNFREKGADSIDLIVKSNHSNLIRYETGIQFAKNFYLFGGNLLPNISVSYVGHRLLSGKKYTAAFPGISTDFSVFGTNELFNQVQVGAGLDYFINDRFALTSWYDIELGNKRQEQEINLELNYRF